MLYESVSNIFIVLPSMLTKQRTLGRTFTTAQQKLKEKRQCCL